MVGRVSQGARPRSPKYVTCRYCETVNAEGRTRCEKCDAQLHSPVARPRAARRRAAAALLPEFPEGLPANEPAAARAAQPATHPARPPFQPSLFGGKEASKVVPIRSGPEIRARAGRGAAQRTTVSGAPRYQQQKLRLAETSASSRRHVQDKGVVSCTAPVASVTHRVLAFAIDLSLVTIASGSVMLGFVVWGGVHLAGKPAAVFCGAGLLLAWMLYQLLWSAANLDSVGMNWVRLRLLDFNGYRPKMRQRLVRLGVMCLGTLAAGLGLAWSLVDEEGLTWQDHVSETFPTSY